MSLSLLPLQVTGLHVPALPHFSVPFAEGGREGGNRPECLLWAGSKRVSLHLFQLILNNPVRQIHLSTALRYTGLQLCVQSPNPHTMPQLPVCKTRGRLDEISASRKLGKPLRAEQKSRTPIFLLQQGSSLRPDIHIFRVHLRFSYVYKGWGALCTLPH